MKNTWPYLNKVYPPGTSGGRKTLAMFLIFGVPIYRRRTYVTQTFCGQPSAKPTLAELTYMGPIFTAQIFPAAGVSQPAGPGAKATQPAE